MLALLAALARCRRGTPGLCEHYLPEHDDMAAPCVEYARLMIPHLRAALARTPFKNINKRKKYEQ